MVLLVLHASNRKSDGELMGTIEFGE